MPRPVSLVRLLAVQLRRWCRDTGFLGRINDLGVRFQEREKHRGNRAGKPTDDFHTTLEAAQAAIKSTFFLDESLIEGLPRLALAGMDGDQIHFPFQQAVATPHLPIVIRGCPGLKGEGTPAHKRTQMGRAGEVANVANFGKQHGCMLYPNHGERKENLPFPRAFQLLADQRIEFSQVLLQKMQLADELALFEKQSLQPIGLLDSDRNGGNVLELVDLLIAGIMPALEFSQILKGGSRDRRRRWGIHAKRERNFSIHIAKNGGKFREKFVRDGSEFVTQPCSLLDMLQTQLDQGCQGGSSRDGWQSPADVVAVLRGQVEHELAIEPVRKPEGIVLIGLTAVFVASMDRKHEDLNPEGLQIFEESAVIVAGLLKEHGALCQGSVGPDERKEAVDLRAGLTKREGRAREKPFSAFEQLLGNQAGDVGGFPHIDPDAEKRGSWNRQRFHERFLSW